MKNQLYNLLKSKFFMNAFYIMLSTFVVAVAGFLFWIVVTRKYDVGTVGLSTTLLSVSNLLSLMGMAGFDTTFVRFLPNSSHKNDYTNTGIAVVTIASTVLSVVVGLALIILLPHMAFLSNGWSFTGFVFFTVATALNTLTNAVFLAYKKAVYIFIINTLYSAFKVVLPLVITGGNAMTIFVLAGSAQLLGAVLSIAWMIRKFHYEFSPRLHLDALRAVKKFSLSVYISSLLNLLPPTILPLIIIYFLGSKSSAYYFMAFTIASVLYIIAYASMQMVFVEGSHNPAAIYAHVTKSVRIIVTLLIPAAVLTALLSGPLLSVFGHQYAVGASTLLAMFALGSLPVALYAAIGAIFKVTKNLRGVVGMNVAYAVVILGLSYLLIPHFGLIAVGWAWIIGNLAACGTGAIFLLNTTSNKLGEEVDGEIT